MEAREEKKRKLTAEGISPPAPMAGQDEKEMKEILAYLIVTFSYGPFPAAIYEVKIEIGGGREAEELNPLVKLFDGKSDAGPLSCDMLGSDLYFFSGGWYGKNHLFSVVGPVIFNTETKKTSEPYQKPPMERKDSIVVISANEKFFFISNRPGFAVPVPQPSFEVFDPKSGSSEILSAPPFHSNDVEFSRAFVSGFVVAHGYIIISMENVSGRPIFFSYNLGLRIWKFVSTIEGVRYPFFTGRGCLVGGRVYGCSYYGDIIAYPCVVLDRFDADIFLGQPVEFTHLKNTEEILHIGELFEYPSACIAPIGKDMLCFVHANPNYTYNGTQPVSIKILKIDDGPSLKILSSTSRTLNTKGLDGAILSYCCILA